MKTHQFIDHPELIKAREEFEDAAKKYSAACHKVAQESGKFVGKDNKFDINFRAIDGSQKKAEIILTDC